MGVILRCYKSQVSFQIDHVPQDTTASYPYETELQQGRALRLSVNFA